MNQLVTLLKYQEATGSDDAPQIQLESIMDASAAILDFTDRDFDTDLVTEAREFDIPDEGFIIEIDDATEITDVTGIGGGVWRAGREGPVGAAGVYSFIEVGQNSRESLLLGFSRNWDRFGNIAFNQKVTVTGTWGWPEVPLAVQRAAIIGASAYEGDPANRQGALAAKSVAEVAENYLQQQAQFTGGNRDYAPLPARALSLIEGYRRLVL